MEDGDLPGEMQIMGADVQAAVEDGLVGGREMRGIWSSADEFDTFSNLLYSLYRQI